MTQLYIADTHFLHENVLRFDNRLFPDMETHDRVLIENWRNRVDVDDDVYVLGDISLGNSTKTIEIVEQLTGRLHWIPGNHCKKLLKNKKLRDMFVEITDYKEMTDDNGNGIVLCHYPIPCFNAHYYGWIMLCGHTHNSYEHEIMEKTRRMLIDATDGKKPCNMINVGAMHSWMQYCPRSFTEIIDGYNETQPDKYKIKLDK